MRDQTIAPLLCLIAIQAFAAQSPAATKPEEKILIEEKDRVWPKVVGFPLDIAPWIINAIGYPLYKFGDYAERTNLPLRAIDFFSNDERTAYWYPKFRAGGKGGAYIGLGGQHRDLWHRGLQGRAGLSLSPGLDIDAALSLIDPSVAGKPISFGMKNSYYRRQNEDFYGIGNYTSKNGGKFEGRLLTVEAPFKVQITPGLSWSLKGRFVGLQQEDASKNGVGSLYPASDLAGLGEFIPAGEAEVEFAYDSRDARAAPETGGVLRASLSRLQGTDNFGFFQVRARATRFIPLWKRGRGLAFGTTFDWAFTPDDGKIPFILHPHLGGNRGLRAYDDFRFTDKSAILLVGEYRYPIWRFAEMAAFFDTGRVADDPRGLGFGGLHYAYGGVLRFRARNVPFFRILVAHGGDGFRFTIAVNEDL